MIACRHLLLFLLLPLLAGCETLAYYGQAVGGQLSLMSRSRPIAQLLDDPATEPWLVERLQRVRQIRRFASDELGLPDNDSYSSYADLQREAVVWSVVAAPAYSLEPKRWCYLLVGCLAYRGFFDREAAQRHAERLSGEGWDVTVEPAAAYSTLGWFDDPLPSTVIRWPEPDLAGLIFHELAHQQLYVDGDTAFNESFAMLVEEMGVRRWLERQGTASDAARWQLRQQRRGEFVALLLDYKGRLAAFYASEEDPQRLAAGKQRHFDQLRTAYRQLRDESWVGWDGFDAWFERDLNNARLASVNTYYQWLPALRRLLAQQGGDFRHFHQACAELGRLPDTERERQLRILGDAAGDVDPAAR